MTLYLIGLGLGDEKDVTVRLLPLYNYLMELLIQNTRNPSQLIVDNSESAYYRSGFTITMETQADGNHHLIAFDSSESFAYRGRNFAISVVVQDRLPFMDYNTSSETFTAYDPDGVN